MTLLILTLLSRLGERSLVEPYISGRWEKYNSNTGFLAEDTDYMQALSHFSYWWSIAHK